MTKRNYLKDASAHGSTWTPEADDILLKGIAREEQAKLKESFRKGVKHDPAKRKPKKLSANPWANI